MLNRITGPQTLLIDADDTLWENNIYFERAIASFISLLNHHSYTPQQVRLHLNECEHRTIKQFGYGLKSFRRSLVRCMEDLSTEPLTETIHEQINHFTDAIATQQIELLEGVQETLADLASRHRILLVTKGDDWEQRDKLSRSGLERYFSGVEVLPEKHSDAYRSLREKHACEAQTTWMIGNSPKSDINPALDAGLNAIFVPHPHTWVLEHESVLPAPEGQTLMEIGGFRELRGIFVT